MGKYRKLPVEIEAEVYKEGMEDGFAEKDILRWHSWTPEDGECTVVGTERKPYVQTFGRRYFIDEGDYIITGVKDERYPCKPDVFEMTYEKVADFKPFKTFGIRCAPVHLNECDEV